MDAIRWGKIKEIYGRALDLSREERESFLAEACAGAADLRREIETLLVAHEDAGTFLQAPAYKVAAREIVADEVSSPATQLIGRELANYRIVSMLGRGGMGEVYLAQDTKLGRKVALKLLPSQFVGDKQRVLRFEQEARAVSILNHPNIVTIFDAGQIEDIYFIATEYIDGRTLRAELKEQGRLPVREALRIALQIADALSTAHEVGILHRDIKPENVMVRRDGIVKLLDFGLAKVAESLQQDPDTGAASPSNSYLSEAGAVFGTVNYMSPEQARGHAVDARTDVFSFGVTLYEMLIGRQPFAAEAMVDQIAKLLTTEPVPLTQLAPEIPTELQRVVQQALSKEREARQRTINEFARQLRRIAEELQIKDLLNLTGESPAAVADASPPTRRFSARLSRRSLIAIGTIIVATLLGGPFARRLMKSNPIPSATVSEFDPVRLTHDLASDTAPTWSPDGKQIAFTSNREGQEAIFVMNADGSGVRRIHNGLLVSNGPNWQPDGRIRFGGGRNIYTMKPDGSDVVRVNTSGALSPDGRQILFVKEVIPGEPSSNELFVANADGSNSRRLTHNKIADVDPRWSPDGRKIAYSYFPDGPWPKASICVINSDGSELTRLTNALLKAGPPVWSPDGTRIAFGVINDQNAIYVMNADGRNQMRLTYQMKDWVGYAWSPDGKKIAYAADYEGNFEIYVINSDPSRQTNITHHLAEDMYPSWSPDGKKIAFTSNREGRTALYVMNSDGGEQRKVLNDIQEQLISWSPDGLRFAFSRKDLEHTDLYLANADGGNIVKLANDAAGPQWSPDGRSIVFVQGRDGYMQLYAIDLESKALMRLSNSQEKELLHSFSPDGKHILFNRSRKRNVVLKDIWIMDSDGGNPRLLATPPNNDEFIYPRFSPDGRRIAFQRFDLSVRVWDIWIMNVDGGAQTRLTFSGGSAPSWSPDGKRIAFTSQRRTGNTEIYVMDVSPTAGLQ